VRTVGAYCSPSGAARPGWSPNEVAAAVRRKSSWAVLALTLLIELFTQFHDRKSIREDADLSELFRDDFLYPNTRSSLSAAHPAPGGR
jgi:hypothetical protein